MATLRDLGEVSKRAAVPEPEEGYRLSRGARFNPRSETHVREGTAVKRIGTVVGGSVLGTALGSAGARAASAGLKRWKPAAEAIARGDKKVGELNAKIRRNKAIRAVDDAAKKATFGHSGVVPRSTTNIVSAGVSGAVGGAATTAAIDRNTRSKDVIGYNKRTGETAKRRIAPPGVPGYYYKY